MKRAEVDQLLQDRDMKLVGEKLEWRFHEANYSCELRLSAPDGIVDTKTIKMDRNTE